LTSDKASSLDGEDHLMNRGWADAKVALHVGLGRRSSEHDDGIASFNRIRHRHHDADVFMWAFDLIEPNGDDLRRDPLNVRKATLASVLARAAPGLRLNEHLEADGPDVFHHACMLGLEGIVSKRKDSQSRSGRSPHWIKSKNPNAPAVKREAEEDWGQCRG
jgi:bifunctional non-homologous end joining protein LigD